MCTKEGASEFFRVGWLGNCLLKLLHCLWQKELIDSPILTQIFSLKKDQKKQNHKRLIRSEKKIQNFRRQPDFWLNSDHITGQKFTFLAY